MRRVVTGGTGACGGENAREGVPGAWPRPRSTHDAGNTRAARLDRRSFPTRDSRAGLSGGSGRGRTHCTAISLNFGEFMAVGSMSAAVIMATDETRCLIGRRL